MTIKNLAASVHARLTERARKEGRPFQELLEYFAIERFLYRLSSSPHADKFVLKGALMLRVWETPGDVVVPAAKTIGYPTLLDFPAPKMKGYPRETVVAEKFEAMVKLGTLNSRMRDFFDIWLMARQFDFDGALLARGDLDLQQSQDGDRSSAGRAHPDVHREPGHGGAMASVPPTREVHLRISAIVIAENGPT